MTQKLIPALIIIFIIAALIAGISAMRSMQNSDESSEGSVLQMTEALIVPSEIPSRISLDVPAAFQETNSNYYDKYYVCNDASIIITGEEMQLYGVSLEDYATNVRQQYESTAEKFQLLSESDIRINAKNCRLFEFTYDIVGSSETLTMQCMTAVFLEDDEAFIITCKSHADTFQSYRPLFSKTIESVEIAPKSGETQPAPETSLTFPPLEETETLPQNQPGETETLPQNQTEPA